MLEKGLFITVEGADGAGKSTFSKWIENYLINEKMLATLYTREPGGCVDSEDIREILVNPFTKNMSEQTRLLLVLAARSLHQTETIVPALQKKCIVVCDRFIDSTYVYQGSIGGLSSTIDKFKAMPGYNKIFIRPDYTFYFDVSPGVAKKRLAKRAEKDNNSLDDVYMNKLKKINTSFRSHFNKLNSDNVIVIDANKTQQEVQMQVKENIDKILSIQKDVCYVDYFQNK